VSDAAARLREAADLQAEAAAQVRRREAAIAAVLPVALRLSLYPAETILAAPVPPDQALAGLLATRGLSAQLAADIRALRDEQAQQAARARAVSAHAAALDAARTRQSTEAAGLDRQLAQARAAQKAAETSAEAAAQQEAALAAQAQTLRGAIAAMDLAERRQATPSGPAGPGLALAAGHAPVAGAVLRGWGAAAEDGPATGITFAATPGAFVTSPCAGRIGFAAPFRSYGKLIIVECGQGYDFVLAGLDRLDAAVGRRVRRGEPLGRMPAGAQPGLYLELRLNGRPVDPAPFLNAKA
jgi:septal ring factor EnvC (AmiA/AmiB activator)